MEDFTQLLLAVEQGDKSAADVLPLIYEDLRRMAAHMMAAEKPGQTLQPTALVHEAYLKVFAGGLPKATSKRHFFCIAAEAMRRIIVDSVRRKRSVKHGGGAQREELDEAAIAMPSSHDEILAVHEALDTLTEAHAAAADLDPLR